MIIQLNVLDQSDQSSLINRSRTILNLMIASRDLMDILHAEHLCESISPFEFPFVVHSHTHFKKQLTL
jgi:hypothetical protein